MPVDTICIYCAMSLQAKSLSYKTATFHGINRANKILISLCMILI